MITCISSKISNEFNESDNNVKQKHRKETIHRVFDVVYWKIHTNIEFNACYSEIKLQVFYVRNDCSMKINSTENLIYFQL